MAAFHRLHRNLDPASTMGELIFGMIMVMTFTLGARVLGADEPTDGRELMIAALGCNVAWGIIDAFLYLLGALHERRRLASMQATLRRAKRMRPRWLWSARNWKRAFPGWRRARAGKAFMRRLRLTRAIAPTRVSD